MFKKKSEWFKGLLEAEKLIKDGYSYESLTHDWMFFYKKVDNVSTKIGIPNKSCNFYGRVCGARDYLKHYQNTLQRGFISWDLLKMEEAVSGLDREDHRKWIYNNEGNSTEN